MLLGPVVVASLSGELCVNEYSLYALLKGASCIFIVIYLIIYYTATGRASASQDLYAQFQEQKRRIEEEMRMMEQRDEQWRQLQQNNMPGEGGNSYRK